MCQLFAMFRLGIEPRAKCGIQGKQHGQRDQTCIHSVQDGSAANQICQIGHAYKPREQRTALRTEHWQNGKTGFFQQTSGDTPI